MSFDTDNRRARRAERKRAKTKRGLRRRFDAKGFSMLEERCLLSVYTITDPSDGGGSGTLRSIIQQVDSDTTPDVIDFDLPGSAP